MYLCLSACVCERENGRARVGGEGGTPALVSGRWIGIFLSLGFDPVQLTFALAQFELHVTDSSLVSHHDHLQVLKLHQ